MRKNLLRTVAGGLMAAALGVGAAASSSPTLAATDDGQIFQRRTQPTTAGAYSREEADAVAKRLYKGILGREADADGLQGTIDMLTRGQLQRRVNEMIASAEFRSRVANKPANEVLNQLYSGLFNREPDPSGVNAYQGQLQNRRYADVVMHMLQSQEFRDKVNADLGRPSGASGTTSSTASAGEALGCMEQIVEKVRNDLPGAVLLRFESASNEGTAIDVLDNNRRINYNCNGATYSYQDGRNTRSAPNETDFPDDRARACQAEVRSKVGRERNGVDVAFESAGVMVASGVQGVRGLGFERPQGANFMYECTMDGTRVVNSSYRMR